MSYHIIHCIVLKHEMREVNGEFPPLLRLKKQKQKLLS